MRSIFLLALCGSIFLSTQLKGQESGQSRIWYGNYTMVKLDQRWFLDNYLLSSFGTRTHRFSFAQNDLAINYRLDKSQSLYFSYSILAVRWINAYEDRYENEISPLNTIQFNRVAFGYKKLHRFGKIVRLKHDIAAQAYFPSLQKFKYRFIYRSKLSLRNRDWPMRVSPFTQFSLYYCSGGNPIEFEQDEDEFDPDEEIPISTIEAPNGLHRYRIKFGLSFKPFVSFKKLGMTLYYAYNKEFNLSGIGNNLHVYNELEETTHYRFNNYGIYGIQVNLILN